MLQKLHEKMSILNQIVAEWNEGKHPDDQARLLIDQQIRKAFLPKEETLCGNAHNNGEELCIECFAIKTNQ